MYRIKNIESESILDLNEQEFKELLTKLNVRKDSLMVTLPNYPNRKRHRKSCKGWKLLSVDKEPLTKELKDTEFKRTIEYNKNTLTVEDIIQSDVPITESIILSKFNLDEDEWEIDRYRVSQWESRLKSKEDKIQLYSVRATFKRKSIDLDNTSILTAVLNKLSKDIACIDKHSIGTLKPLQKDTKVEDELLVLDIADLHLNKSVGDIYNTKIALEKLHTCVDVICSKTNASEVNFIIGEDMFNIDTLSKTTTKGTPQDANDSYYEMYIESFKSLVKIIYKLSTSFSTISVTLVQGNHDELTSFTVIHALESYFRDFPNIKFNSNPKKRKYLTHGDCLIGLGHLENEAKTNKPFLIQNEVKELFGISKHCYFISGHFHNYNVEDIGGIQFIRLPTLSEPDEWHFRKGYVGSKKGAIGLVFHKRHGLVQKILYNE